MILVLNFVIKLQLRANKFRIIEILLRNNIIRTLVTQKSIHTFQKEREIVFEHD